MMESQNNSSVDVSREARLTAPGAGALPTFNRLFPASILLGKTRSFSP
jgi:hypothetical protein